MKIISHSEVLGVRDIIFATDYINNIKSRCQKIKELKNPVRSKLILSKFN